MNSLIVSSIQRHCVYDGPGVRTTVFLQGCLLRCPWCCNPEMQSVEKKEHTYDIDELCSLLVKDKYLFGISNGGVTFSGGEPLLQADSLLALIKKLHEVRIHVAIETALFVKKGIIEPFLPYVDLWLVDLKYQFGYVFDRNSVVSMDDLTENVFFLKNNISEKIAFRMVFMRECLDHIDDILHRLRNFNIAELTLLSYHTLAKGKYEKQNRKFVDFTIPCEDDFVKISKQLKPIKINRLEV